MLVPAGAPDWRDPDAYSWLEGFGRPAFVWEWLRRDPNYQLAALRALEPKGRGGATLGGHDRGAGAWRLHAFEDACLDASAARPIWRSEDHPSVLFASAVRAAPGPDSFDFERLSAFASIVEDSGVQHVLLSDGQRHIRLDLVGARISEGPVRLRYHLGGMRSLRPPLLTLRQLQALETSGRFSSALHRPEPRGRRMLLLLRCFDARLSGASQRDIARMLLSGGALEKDWRAARPSLRTQAQRLVSGAASMGAGGFWKLLAAP